MPVTRCSAVLPAKSLCAFVASTKPEFTPHVDTGDFIVVINADKLKLSAEKDTKKTYYRHTGYPGGIYETTFREMQDKHPGRALEIAVKGMLPKGPLGLRHDQEAQDLRRRRTPALCPATQGS